MIQPQAGLAPITSKIACILYTLFNFGFNGDSCIVIVMALVGDFFLRMLTAGFTFNYNLYPYNMSSSRLEWSYWIGVFIANLAASLIVFG